MTRSIEQLLEEGDLRLSPSGIATKTTLLMRNGNVLAISDGSDKGVPWKFSLFCFVGFGWAGLWAARHQSLGWIAGFAFVIALIAAYYLLMAFVDWRGMKPEDRSKKYQLQLVMGENFETLFESKDRDEVEMVRDEIERQLGSELIGD